MRAARLKATMLTNSKLKSKGDGLVTRQAAENALLAQGLFENKVGHRSLTPNGLTHSCSPHIFPTTNSETVTRATSSTCFAHVFGSSKCSLCPSVRVCGGRRVFP